MTRTWLFHCNPSEYDIFRAVRVGAFGDNWSARQHRDEIRIGDHAVLYISKGPIGYSSGIFASGTVRSPAWEGVVNQRFWAGRQPEPTEFVDIDFDRCVFHHPIGADELKSDPAFRGKLPRVWQQTVVLLTDSQWEAIDRRVGKRRPTREPRLTRSILTLEPHSPG